MRKNLVRHCLRMKSNIKLLHLPILIFCDINLLSVRLFPAILIPGKINFIPHPKKRLWTFLSYAYARFLCGAMMCPLYVEPYHDVIMNKSLAVACRFEVWVFLSTGHSYPPCFLPSLIQLNMDWIYTRMMRGHCISQIYWNTMLL